MTKTLSQQIHEFEAEKARIDAFSSLLDKAVKIEFGIDRKKLHKMIKNYDTTYDFAKKICDYYGLTSESDMQTFLNLICTDKAMDLFLQSSATEVTTQQG